jgi:hypothetical protein
MKVKSAANSAKMIKSNIGILPDYNGVIMDYKTKHV